MSARRLGATDGLAKDQDHGARAPTAVRAARLISAGGVEVTPTMTLERSGVRHSAPRSAWRGPREPVRRGVQGG